MQTAELQLILLLVCVQCTQATRLKRWMQKPEDYEHEVFKPSCGVGRSKTRSTWVSLMVKKGQKNTKVKTEWDKTVMM